MNKRTAVLAAAGLVVSLAAGSVAFLNGALGLPVSPASRPPASIARHHARVEAYAKGASGPASPARSDGRVTETTPVDRTGNRD